jgi:phosphatidylglycerol:prolipoprotein diacylglycerol transferase
MFPELFHIGPIPIRSYGLMLAISFILGLLYVRYVTRRDKKDFDPFVTIAYIMIIGGIVGARLFYVLTHLAEFEGNWSATFNPFASASFGIAGMNIYGGVLLAIIGTWIYSRVKGMSTLEVFDYFAPTMGLGLGVTRIGCFMNGCCFGTPTDLPWGVEFPAGSIPYSVFGDAHLHPAQLYSSLYGILLFIVLHNILKRRVFIGQVVAILFMVEAFFRFVIEQVRYYESEMVFSFFGFEPTYNQVISVVLFALGLGIILYQRKQKVATN